MVAACPQFVKLAPMAHTAAAAGAEQVVMRTGQPHEDMSRSDVLDVTVSHVHLAVGSISSGAMVGRVETSIGGWNLLADDSSSIARPMQPNDPGTPYGDRQAQTGAIGALAERLVCL